MKKEFTRKFSLWFTWSVWLFFVFLHIFSRIAFFSNHKSIFSYITSALLTLGMTFLYLIFHGALKTFTSENSPFDILQDDLFEDYVYAPRQEKRNQKTRLQNSLLTIFIISTLFLSALAMEIWIPDFTFFTDNTYISFGRFSIDKNHLYDPCLFIVFPLMVQWIFQGMAENYYYWKSVISGILQILALTLMEFLLFMKMSNIWLMELAFLNFVTIIVAVLKYTWKHIEHKKLTILLTLSYGVFWTSLLGLFDFSRYTFIQYTFGNNWDSYVQCVQELLKNASLFGVSAELQSNIMVKEFLLNHSNYLHSALYYFGWFFTILLIVILFIFLLVSKSLLGKCGDIHKNYLMYQAAWWSLALRIIIGIPYSLGVLPIPIGLPMSSSLAFYMDTIAIGLLFWCAFENNKLERLLSYHPMELHEYRWKNENPVVTLTDDITLYEMPMKGIYEEYEEELKKYTFWDDDEVIYKCGDIEIPCKVRWYGYSTRKFAAFEPLWKDNCEYFILEHFPDTQTWAFLDDKDLVNQIGYAVLQRYVPDSYEDIHDLIDW